MKWMRFSSWMVLASVIAWGGACTQSPQKTAAHETSHQLKTERVVIASNLKGAFHEFMRLKSKKDPSIDLELLQNFSAQGVVAFLPAGTEVYVGEQMKLDHQVETFHGRKDLELWKVRISEVSKPRLQKTGGFSRILEQDFIYMLYYEKDPIELKQKELDFIEQQQLIAAQKAEDARRKAEQRAIQKRLTAERQARTARRLAEQRAEQERLAAERQAAEAHRQAEIERKAALVKQLVTAASRGDASAVQGLLSHDDLSPLDETPDGRNALTAAVEAQQASVLHLLLKKNPRLEHRNSRGQTPIELAKQLEDKRMLYILYAYRDR